MNFEGFVMSMSISSTSNFSKEEKAKTDASLVTDTIYCLDSNLAVLMMLWSLIRLIELELMLLSKRSGKVNLDSLVLSFEQSEGCSRIIEVFQLNS
jgi:hypothetical protein